MRIIGIVRGFSGFYEGSRDSWGFSGFCGILRIRRGFSGFSGFHEDSRGFLGFHEDSRDSRDSMRILGIPWGFWGFSGFSEDSRDSRDSPRILGDSQKCVRGFWSVAPLVSCTLLMYSRYLCWMRYQYLWKNSAVSPSGPGLLFRANWSTASIPPKLLEHLSYFWPLEKVFCECFLVVCSVWSR